jgi:pimeloyl-ACP methyl ester carboxylesterase
MDAQVADALAVLDGRRALLVGHSYGGNVALALAARRADLVAGVALYESPLSWAPWWPGTTAGAAALSTPDDPGDAAETFMRRLIGDRRWEGLPDTTKAARRREGVAMVGELGDLRTNPPWSPEQITVPVVAAFGSLGRPHHRRGMEHVAASVGRGVLVELPDCRHDAPLSHPELFAQRVVEPLVDSLLPGSW